MKRVLKSAFSFAVIVILIVLSVFSSFAKGTCLVDNEVTVGYKDTFTYTFYLSDCEKPVVDMVAHIFYDSEYLKLDEDSVDFHDLVGVSRNLNISGHIPFTFCAISNPVDFSKKKPVVSLDFKVIKEGKASVQYFISDLDCGTIENNSPAKKFKFTCDYNVHSTDGDELHENMTPVLVEDKDKLNEYQGAFVNYSDGKGEQADSNKKSSKTSSDKKNKETNKEHIAVTGETQADVIDVKKDKPVDNTTIIIAVSVIVLILVIAIITVLRRVFNAEPGSVKTYESDEKDEE